MTVAVTREFLSAENFSFQVHLYVVGKTSPRMYVTKGVVGCAFGKRDSLDSAK